MPANTIGTGALVLSANADKMLGTLDKAGKSAATKAGDISNKVNQAADPKGGGLLSRLIGGAAAGGVAGIAFAAITGGVKMIAGAFEQLETKAKGFDRKALFGIRQSFVSLKNAGLGVLQKLVTAAAPAIMNLADIALRFLDRVKPGIDIAAKIFEKVAFAGTELVGLLGDGLLAVGGEVVSFIEDLTGMEMSFENLSKVAVGALRGVALGFAYVWDGVKAGTGVIAVVAGIIAKGLALIVGAIADAVGKLAALGDSLPEELRPEWLGKAAATVKGFAETVEGVGDGMINRGMAAISRFGESADAVRGVFDNLDARLAKQKQKIEELAPVLDVKLSGAFQKGSTEAYSIVAKNQTQGMLAESNAKVQLRLLQQGNDLFKQLINTVAGAQIIRAV